MTDNEIIKALMYCKDWHTECDGCSYETEEHCHSALRQDAFNLVQRQLAKIDKLHQTNFNLIKSIGDLVELTRAEAIKEFAEEFDNILAEMRDEYHKRDLISYGLVCETVHARLAMFTKKKGGDGDA